MAMENQQPNKEKGVKAEEHEIKDTRNDEEIQEDVDLASMKDGLPINIPASVEQRMRDAGISEEDLLKKDFQELWQIYKEKILAKKERRAKNRQTKTPEPAVQPENIADTLGMRKEALKDNLRDTMDDLSGEEIKDEIYKIVDIKSKLAEENWKKNTAAEAELFARGSGKAKEPTEEKKTASATPAPKEKANRTILEPKKAMEQFIADYNLADLLPEEFKTLTEDQKIYVVQNLKKRMVDIVDSNAETQYSEYLKQKLATTAKPGSKFKKIIESIKTAGRSIKESGTKESELSKLRSTAFEELQNTEEGRKLIAEDLTLLTDSTQDRKIKYYQAENEFHIEYMSPEDIENCTPEEEKAMGKFNLAANGFRRMPYEWGQEGKTVIGGHKRAYDKAKAEYEKTKYEILNIKAKREKSEESNKVMLEIAALDSQLQMEQLLSTHPEFEKKLVEIEKGGGGERIRTTKNFINTVTGKTWTNRGLVLAGYLARKSIHGAKLASHTNLVTYTGTVAVGGVIGSIKGRYKGLNTLKERQRKARYGEKDMNKERTAMVDMTYLEKRLSDLVENIDKASNPAEKARNVGMLSIRIAHTLGKVEKGEVNFGDSKSMLANHMKFTDTLNRALVFEAISSKEADKDFKERMEALLTYAAKGVKNTTSERENKFIRKQIWEGAKIGAGAATFGYVLRWLGEETGWWGGHGGEHVALKTEVPITKGTTQLPGTETVEETAVPKHIPVGQHHVEHITHHHAQQIEGPTEIREEVHGVVQKAPIINKSPETTETVVHTDTHVEQQHQTKQTFNQPQHNYEMHSGDVIPNRPGPVYPSQNPIHLNGPGIYNHIPVQRQGLFHRMPRMRRIGRMFFRTGPRHGGPDRIIVNPIQPEHIDQSNIGDHAREVSTTENNNNGDFDPYQEQPTHTDTRSAMHNTIETDDRPIAEHHDLSNIHVEKAGVEDATVQKPADVVLSDKPMIAESRLIAGLADEHAHEVLPTHTMHHATHQAHHTPLKKHAEIRAAEHHSHTQTNKTHVGGRAAGHGYMIEEQKTQHTLANHNETDNSRDSKIDSASYTASQDTNTVKTGRINESQGSRLRTDSTSEGLTEDMQRKINGLFRNNMEHIYKTKAQWTNVLRERMNEEAIWEVYANPQTADQSFANYIHRLWKTTNLKPLRNEQGVFERKETYIRRALAVAAKMNALEKVSL